MSLQPAAPAPVDISGITVSDPSAVDLYLPDFNGSATLDILASLMSVSPAVMDASAVAHVPSNLNAWRGVFNFSIENIVDLFDASNNVNDLHFYVVDPSGALTYGNNEVARLSRVQNSSAITSTNLRTGVAFPDSQMTVPQDYLRYLAEEIFGTTAGVDLFYNEAVVEQNIINKIMHIWNTDDVKNVLVPISSVAGTDSHLLTDASGNKYFDNSNANGYQNIGQILFDQLVSLQPSRFTTDASNGLIQDTGDIQPLPFMAGDSISFVYKLRPAAGQEKLTDGTNAIDPRSYRIKMILG